MNKLILVMAAFLVTACAANPHGYQNTDQISERLVGMSATELVAKLGEPSQTTQYGEGAKSMSFRRETKGLTGGQCDISVVVHVSAVYSATVSAKGSSWFSNPLDACLSLIKNLD